MPKVYSEDDRLSNSQDLQDSFQFVFITQTGGYPLRSVNYFKFSIMFLLLLISVVPVRAADEQQIELFSTELSDINPLMDFCEYDNDEIVFAPLLLLMLKSVPLVFAPLLC